MRRGPCFPSTSRTKEHVTEGFEKMSTNTDQDSTSEKVAITENASVNPAIVATSKPIDGPRIHLYTSLSSGSSSVLPPLSTLTTGEYRTITY